MSAVIVLTSGATFWPGIAFWLPLTTTRSSAVIPEAITRKLPSSCPVFTVRCCTMSSLSTTSR